MADTEFTDADEGKTVINDEGDDAGVISEVYAGRAYVDPDPAVTDKIMSALGWGDDDEYALDADNVEHITDDEVRLSSEL